MKQTRIVPGIITSPFLLKAGVPPLSNLIDVMCSLSNEVYVITGGAGSAIKKIDKAYIYLIKLNKNKFFALKYLIANIKISYKICLLKSVNVWFFYLGERPLLIPIFISKLLGKKAIIICSSSLTEDINMGRQNKLNIMNIVDMITRSLAFKIIISSANLIDSKSIKKYPDKFLIISEHFIDTNEFKITIPFNERDNLIGYIGRFSEEKGILNFVNAISKLAKKEENISFLIGGQGDLQENIKEMVEEYNLKRKIEFAGWIPHEILPTYLNRLKLLVVPSYTETGPLIMLEAMACGTPVLITRVGLAPEIIKDGETGFILKNNSAKNIEDAVINSLNNLDLEKIADRASFYIKQNFTHRKVVERYKPLISSLEDEI